MNHHTSGLEKVLKISSRENKPFVVLPLESYESLLATLEELSDPGALSALRESEADVRAGRIVSHKEVFSKLDAQDKLHGQSRKRSRQN